MSAAIYQGLLVCDEARYTPGLDLKARLEELRILVEADRMEAQAMIGRLTGCPRTIGRHREYLHIALAD